MTDPDPTSELERLRAELAALKAQLQGSGAIAQSGSVAAGEGGQAAGNNIVNIHVGPAEAAELLRDLGFGSPSPDLEEAARVYLQYLVDAYQFLDLRGMGISDRVALKLPLLEMYVPLKAREGPLQRKLEALCAGRGHADPARAAEAFLKDVREHSSLLLSRGERQYGFIHLTFQEYLAAVALARKAREGTDTLIDVLAPHVDEAPWHEAVLLAVGHLAILEQWEQAASEVVEGLLQRAPGSPGEAAVWMGSTWRRPASSLRIWTAFTAPGIGL